MADRPILFSAPMVRALLEGRKTQTRRIIKPQPTGRIDPLISYNHGRMEIAFGPDMRDKDGGPKWWRPLAQAGDRLWVREAWRCEARLDKRAPRDIATNYPGVKYIATDEPDSFGIEGKYRQAMHMPRWASRLTLIATDVRIQRLQDISKADAIAEGVERDSDGWRDYMLPHTRLCVSATGSFQTLWNHINGPDAWKANPLIAAYTFRVINCNIDQVEVAA